MATTSSTLSSFSRFAAAALTFVGRLVLDLIAPLRCAGCDVRLGSNALFCGACASTVVPARATLSDGRAVFLYGGAVADAIARYKYGGRPDLASRLGAAMATAAAPLERRVDVVVSVPLHPKRLAERGFDQSALLARSVAQRLLVPWAPRALARTRETAQQASLDRDARAENVASAFRCRDAESVVGRRVLLIDDVRTTGSTLSACIRALRIAGARSVNTMVLARRDRDEPTDAPAALGAELRPPKETSIVV